MGASKQLPTDLEIKIIDDYELGEGYKKVSGRFGLSGSTVRKVVQEWTATGTVLVQERFGRKKIHGRHRRRMDSQNGHRQATGHLQRTTRTSGRSCSSRYNPPYCAPGKAHWKGDVLKAFP